MFKVYNYIQMEYVGQQYHNHIVNKQLYELERYCLHFLIKSKIVFDDIVLNKFLLNLIGK